MEKASRRDVLNRDRDSLVREYTTYANRASNLITQNTTSFQTQQQQQQASQGLGPEAYMQPMTMFLNQNIATPYNQVVLSQQQVVAAQRQQE